MSDREYFSLRYAVPGFTFILTIVGVNYSNTLGFLRQSGSTEAFGAFLSFLALFAGSAIGFLVAQIWFSYFHWRRIYYSHVFKHLESLLKENLNFEPKTAGKGKDVTLSAVLDYILLYKRGEKYWKYCQRRWDIFHTLSCTSLSLKLGIFTGLLLRIILMCSFTSKGLGELLNYEIYRPFIEQFPSLSAQVKIDTLMVLFTLISVIVLIFILHYGKRQVFNEYFEIMKILIRKSSPEFQKSLNDVFPQFFIKKGTNPLSEIYQ